MAYAFGLGVLMGEQQANLQQHARQALKDGYRKLNEYGKAVDAAGAAAGYAAGFKAGYEQALREQAEQIQTLIKAMEPPK